MDNKVKNAGTIDAKLDSYNMSGITELTNNMLMATGSDAHTTMTCQGTASDPTQAAADAALVCSHINVFLKPTNGTFYSTMTLAKAPQSGVTRKNFIFRITLDDMDTLPSADVTVSGINLSLTFIQA